MSQDQIELIELSLEEARAKIARAEAVRRLSNNPDFRAIVLEGYHRDEAVRLVHLVNEPTLPDGAAEQVQVAIAGIAAFDRYMRLIVQQADVAERSIAESEQALEELRLEELHGSDGDVLYETGGDLE